jgi:FMN-dependent NADH-azoreductase
MKLLHIDSSILGPNSVSRSLSKAAVDRLVSDNADIEVTYRDLVEAPIAHLTGRYLAGQSADVQHDQALQEDLALGGRVLEEFLAADVIVIGVAFYNFSVASQLKAWVDRVAVAGKTFRYSENGAEGLAGGKRVILAIARGGFYGAGSPTASFEHAESFLRSVFTFLGVKDIEVVAAEGIAMGPEQRASATSSALETISTLKAA